LSRLHRQASFASTRALSKELEGEENKTSPNVEAPPSEYKQITQRDGILQFSITILDEIFRDECQ
jgi:hypothetical protein